MLALLLGLCHASPLQLGQPYALEVTQVSVSAVPIIGDTRVQTRSAMLAQFEQRGDGIVQRQQLCYVNVTDDARLSETRIPPAFVRAFPKQEVAISLSQEGAGWRYDADPGPSSVGYDPTRTDAVPAEAAHPSVVDWEGDGQPGATVQLVVPVLGPVEVYIAQHGHLRFSGTVDAQGGVRGRLSVLALEQRTLGASHRLFHTNTDIRVQHDENVFRLVPVVGEASCAAVARTLESGPEV